MSRSSCPRWGAPASAPRLGRLVEGGRAPPPAAPSSLSLPVGASLLLGGGLDPTDLSDVILGDDGNYYLAPGAQERIDAYVLSAFEEGDARATAAAPPGESPEPASAGLTPAGGKRRALSDMSNSPFAVGTVSAPF